MVSIKASVSAFRTFYATSSKGTVDLYFGKLDFDGHDGLRKANNEVFLLPVELTITAEVISIGAR